MDAEDWREFARSLGWAAIPVVILLGIALAMNPMQAHGHDWKRPALHTCTPAVEDFEIHEGDAWMWQKYLEIFAKNGVKCFQASPTTWTCVRKCGSD